MPRVSIKQKEYIKEDFKKAIDNHMYGKYNQTTLAKEFGISQPAMCKKIQHLIFSYDELMILFTVLDFSNDEIARFMKLGNSA